MSSEAMQVREAAPSYRAGADAQDVPPGYKRTDVGVIPGDWKVVPLGMICSMKSGEGITAVHIDSTSRYPCYGGNGLRGFTNRFTHSGRFGLIGRQGALCGNVLGVSGEFFASEHAVVVTAFQQTDIAWLTYVLGAMHLNQYSESSAQPGLSVSKLLTLNVPCPPTETEQRAIAEALSHVDGLLGALETLIAKKRAIKQATMQQLLTGKARLPGFSGEWETKRLGEIGHFLKGSGVKREDARSGRLACVRYGEIYTVHNDYVRTFQSWISSEAADMATRLEYGDLLFAGSGETKEEIGKCVAIVTEAEAYAGGDIVILRPRDVDPLFFGYALNIPNVARQKASLGQGDAVVHISVAALAQLSLAVPSIEEQAAIATVLFDMDAEIAALEARRNKTRAIKQGMMQQLLTGRVRMVKPKVQAQQLDAEAKANPAHSKAFNEAVIISVLAKRFGKEEFPLGRMRYTKLSYLLHRHADGEVADYLKKAAGPYNPKTKYGGPERIALQKAYIREQSSGKYRGFVSGENVSEAEVYFDKWYGRDALTWLEQFRYTKNDKLEALATVDMAVEELRAAGKDVNPEGVKALIRNHSEWKAKLRRPMFSDAAIDEMLKMCHAIYGER